MNDTIAPERTDPDYNSPPCLCGATPLLTATGGRWYMSCPPCWVRTHKAPSAEHARLQWAAMLRPEPRRVLTRGYAYHGESYKTLAYVQRECADLAALVAAVGAA